MLVSLFIAALRGLTLALYWSVAYCDWGSCPQAARLGRLMSPRVFAHTLDGLSRLTQPLWRLSNVLERRGAPWEFHSSGRDWQRYCAAASDARMIAAIFDERFPPASELAAKVRRESLW